MAQAAAKQQKALPASARTVTVACKIPTGLWLQLQRPVERMEDTRDGPRPRSYNAFYGPRYYVNGPAYPVGALPKGFPRQPQIEGGYALTTGIPADFWEQWIEQNEKADFVRPIAGSEHGAIFAYATIEDTAAAARENEKALTGLEPISTDEDARGALTDRRLPKPISGFVGKLQPDHERAAQQTPAAQATQG